jgi:plasmid stabilization system protein ParE
MTRQILITLRAREEAQADHDWWAEYRSAEQAQRWYGEFLKAAKSLADNPERCGFAPENGRYPYEIRQLNFGLGRRPTHRLVYAIRSHEVIVLRVRHLAQDAIVQSECDVGRAENYKAAHATCRTWLETFSGTV